MLNIPKSIKKYFLVGVILLVSIGLLFSVVGCEQTKPTDEETEEATSTAPAETEAKTNLTGGLPEMEEGFNCTYCHGSIDYGRVREKLFDRKMLIFTHVPHINIGTKCSRCHKLPVHEPEQVHRPPMDICYSSDCHGLEAAKASGKCSLCHPPVFELKPGSGSVYGDHFASNFVPPKHADLALAEEGKNCGICHKTQFCMDCHKMEMPHPDAFKTGEHGAIVKKDRQNNQDSCKMCHPNYDFCESCHHQGWSSAMGDWTLKAHPVIAKKNGAEGCFECHGPSYAPFCADCHVRMFR
ncbi:hypothetical protein [Candidatus Oleimmundimicrobium sp.]|uniref:hypothetical protein n=1 Tax=Candidatus Oleimmundimicrobium sp. TaxID=3060597 RepID=UPI00271FFAC4|nr:hypothetical protein [Candidatus Oleimmundimicrobium sp.]MDO8885929.1 hypothetical protein [Candidatus Oleimmundimicrobium sp.]